LKTSTWITWCLGSNSQVKAALIRFLSRNVCSQIQQRIGDRQRMLLWKRMVFR